MAPTGPIRRCPIALNPRLSAGQTQSCHTEPALNIDSPQWRTRTVLIPGLSLTPADNSHGSPVVSGHQTVVSPTHWWSLKVYCPSKLPRTTICCLESVVPTGPGQWSLELGCHRRYSQVQIDVSNFVAVFYRIKLRYC
ncbi:hypothetical protein RRG08_014638 [Elysia crispata]|uniref:Uncharacterized protein n=1 Tax=Elysia crispata TaxID=231223 RepID=A0AAE1CZ14_9GAST|nr:hypothetical protein RRG08_014638 [Elysia crispata]